MSVQTWGGKAAQRTRTLVLWLYGDTCWLCGQPGANSVDHVVPIQWGGAMWDLDNMRPAHLRCNQARGNRTRHVRHRNVPLSLANTTSRSW